MEGFQTHLFTSTRHRYWTFLCQLRHLQNLYYQCGCDCILLEAVHSGKRLFSMLDRRVRLLAKQVGRNFSLQDEVDKKDAVRKSQYAKLLKEQHGLDAAAAAKLLDRAMAEHQEANSGRGRQRWVNVGR